MCTKYDTNLRHASPQVWHGRVTVYDPLQLSLEMDWFPHHASPNAIVFGTQPRFELRHAALGSMRHEDGSKSVHTLKLVQLHDTYDMGGQVGQPWVLHGQTPLSESLEYYFCINDWPYTAFIAQDMVDLPPYVQPRTVCKAGGELCAGLFFTHKPHIIGPPKCVCNPYALVWCAHCQGNTGNCIFCRISCSDRIQCHHTIRTRYIHSTFAQA